jgi:hypothetical protein
MTFFEVTKLHSCPAAQDVNLKKLEYTLNFNVAELSPQRSVYGSVNGEFKKECSGFRSSTIFSYQCQHENAEVERKDMTRLKNIKKTETAIEQNSLYWCHGF